MYVWNVCRWLSQWWFVFAYWGWCYSEWWCGFDNTCAVLGKWNVSRVIPRLYGWVYKTSTLSTVVQHNVAVISERLNPTGSQFSIPVFWISGSLRETQLRTPTLDVRVQLPLGWNTYLLFNTDIVNFVWKTNEGEAASIVLLIFFFGGASIFGGWGVMGWDRKSYLGPAEIASFSSRDFCRRNKYDKCCIDWIFLRFIFMNHCCFRFTFLEVYKNLGFPLSNYHFYSQQPHR